MEYRSIGMEGILVGKSRFTYADKEAEIKCKNQNIRCYNGGDSYRFVFYKNKRSFSGLHLQKNTQGYAIVSSVFTKKEHRRKGYAKQLFLEAKKHLLVFHSTNLSEDGKGFANSVN